MSKLTKIFFKSILLNSVMSLVHTNAKAQNSLLPEFDIDENDNEQIGEIKRKVIKNVVKVSPTGRMTTVNSHRSHSSHRSHRSHYSGSSGHSSHSSHYSSSRSSHYSSTTTTRTTTPAASGLLSTPEATPKTKTPADYSIGDRIISAGTYGADVDALTRLLTSKYYLKADAVKKKSGYALFDTNTASAVKHFQKDAGLTVTGKADNATTIALQVWDENKTTIELGFRDLSLNMSGYDVNTLVQMLISAGYAPNPNKLEYKNGVAVFNEEVVTAIKMFQAFSKMEVTGIPDTQTISKLKSIKR